MTRGKLIFDIIYLIKCCNNFKKLQINLSKIGCLLIFNLFNVQIIVFSYNIVFCIQNPTLIKWITKVIIIANITFLTIIVF